MNLQNMFCKLKEVNVICSRILKYQFGKYSVPVVNYSTPSITLGKTKKVKSGPVLEKQGFPVEKDPHKLVKYVCGSNILKEGTDVELKPDNEYPDWLWDLHIGKPKTLDELDPNTLKYWRKVREAGMRRKNKLNSIRKY